MASTEEKTIDSVRQQTPSHPPRATPTCKNYLLDALLRANGLDSASLSPEIFLETGKDPFDSLKTTNFVIFPTTAVIAVLGTMQDGFLPGVAIAGFDGSAGMAPLFSDAQKAYKFKTVQQGHALAVPSSTVDLYLEVSEARETLNEYLRFFIEALSMVPHCASRHSADKRIARWLGSVYVRSPLKSITVTHEFIAGYLSLRRESVTESLGRLAATGAIELHRGIIAVRDQDLLIENCCSCGATDKQGLSRWQARARPTTPSCPATTKEVCAGSPRC
ncbi:MAG: Crp/Fnr family transcriptional regulator [Gammaproteobacteria bacterium]|jgi:Crp-like helix-turn-helix domain|nr:Crp/Fnr family transcriptional regulator [Gammaproteobacteria bacterium]